MDESYDAMSALETQESIGLRGVKDIAFGSVAGMISKVFEHPFDLCKVRLQAQVLEEVQRFKGPVDCLTQTWQSEGIRGLYRGLPLPLFGAILENAALFMTYNQLQIGIKKLTGRPGDLSLGEKSIAAAGGGTVASFILTPLELIKCKMQVQMMAAEAKRLAAHSSEPLPPIDRRLLPGPLALVKEVLRTDGVRGLWLGQTGTFLREAGGAVAWFGTKEYVAKLLLRQHARPSPDAPPLTPKDLAVWESALAGAAAGIAYNIALFPADSVKSTLQTELELRGGRAGPKSTFFGTFVALWRARGLRGLYAGCGVTVARAIPSSAMIFVIYDTLDRTFG